ncbi:MAG: tetratricopeptide repeat protein [Ardenticatenaceae bacterium]|nr:tetratricopeptide repeat protein [Ardenticatenaceae bacterium]
MEFEQLFRRGTQLLHQGKVTEARPFLEQAHKLDPAHMDAALNLSGAYILTKKFRKAVIILESLSKQYPDEAMIWTNLGAAYLGNPVLARDEEQLKAIAAFEKALAVNPVAPNVAYNIALIYRDRQEKEKAIAWFKKAIQANPNDRDARNLLRTLAKSE